MILIQTHAQQAPDETLFTLPPLPDTRQQHFAVFRVIGKRAAIPAVIADCARKKVGDGEDRECQSGGRPGGHGEPRPFDHFS